MTALVKAALETPRPTRLAWRQHQKLLQLGADVERNRREQLIVLHWFWEKPERCEALGCESFEEYLGWPDVQQALGHTAISQGAISKLYLLVGLDAILPDMAITGPDHSKLEAAATALRPKVTAWIEAPKTERPQIEQALRQDVETIRAMTSREVEKAVQTRRDPPYRLTRHHDGRPAIAQVDGDGELKVILVQSDDCDPLAFATVVRRLTGANGYLMYDDDGLWGNSGAPAARWVEDGLPQAVKQAVADRCRAERRM